MKKVSKLKRHISWCFLSVLALSGARAIGAAAEGVESVENFGLFDASGKFRELYYYEKDPETRAFVLFIQGNGCPLVQKRIPELNALQERYREDGVRFWMINSNFQDTRDEVAEEMAAFDSSIPTLMDSAQLVAQSLGVERTAQTFLVDTSDWSIRYRGAIDDRLDYESEKPEAEQSYLTDAIDAFLAGEAIARARVDGPGCKITFPSRRALSKTGVSYAEDVAPMLRDHCVRCHRKDGIGPFSMSSHRKVVGWSEMIREVVMTRRMPPWQADPHIGVFSNDFSLSDEQRQTLVHWIDSGCPKEGETDPLAAIEAPETVWVLGEPDRVIVTDPMEVPASGVIDYQYARYPTDITEPTWVTGFDVVPGDRSVLHHVIAYAVPETKNKGDQPEDRRWIGGYAPGVEAELFPTGSGILLQPSEEILLELHYTTSGKPTVDESRIGLYFSERTDLVELRTGVFVNDKIEIPPHRRDYPDSDSVDIDEDIVVFSLFPHMHYRGKSMAFELEKPDGARETLLSVPFYHFNWQRGYVLAEPLKIAKGSTMHLRASWDNSELNSWNPDPSQTVRWGQQSFEEMLFGTFRYVRLSDWAQMQRPIASVAP